MSLLYAFKCTVYMPGAYVSRKKALKSLALALWMIVSLHVVSGNHTRVLCRSMQVLKEARGFHSSPKASLKIFILLLF